MLSFDRARQKVIEVASACSMLLRARSSTLFPRCGLPTAEPRPQARACGRVLAEPIVADRDYPPFDRSTRDGFAVRAADAAVPGVDAALALAKSKPGSGFDRGGGRRRMRTDHDRRGRAARRRRGGDDRACAHLRRACHVRSRRRARPKYCAARQRGTRRPGTARRLGTRLGYAEMAVAAQVGAHRVSVWARPRVAVLSTGDEMVDIDATPGPLQIRNSNGLALETLVALGRRRASAASATHPMRRDELRRRIERGLEADVLVLSRRRLDGEVRSGRRRARRIWARSFFSTRWKYGPDGPRCSADAAGNRCLGCRAIRFRPW